MADVFGRDLALSHFAAADVGVDGPRRHPPSRRLLVLVVRDERVEFFGVEFLRRRAEDLAERLPVGRCSLGLGHIASFPTARARRGGVPSVALVMVQRNRFGP